MPAADMRRELALLGFVGNQGDALQSVLELPQGGKKATVIRSISSQRVCEQAVREAVGIQHAEKLLNGANFVRRHIESHGPVEGVAREVIDMRMRVDNAGHSLVRRTHSDATFSAMGRHFISSDAI